MTKRRPRINRKLRGLRPRDRGRTALSALCERLSVAIAQPLTGVTKPSHEQGPNREDKYDEQHEFPGHGPVLLHLT